MAHISVLFFNILSKFISTHIYTHTPVKPCERLECCDRCNSRRNNAMAGSSSSVTLSHPQANFLQQTCIAGFVKHLSPHTGCITGWNAFGQSHFVLVSTVVRACNFYLSALRHIRSLVSGTVAQQIACSIVESRLDYCNSLLVNCSNQNLNKLQRVQDNLARVVCNSIRSTSAGPLLRSLHWLPVRQRINFKLAKLCYLVTSFQQPGYLADLISPYSQSRLLRSSTQKLLSVPPHNLDTAARCFSVAAPRLWNSLSLNCRTAPSVNTFKICLETFLFDSA